MATSPINCHTSATLIPATVTEHPPMSPSPFAAFEQHVFERMRRGNLPGISAAVVTG